METRKSNQPTWETVRYMIAQIQYGGRITDDLDQKLMNTYAERFFNQVTCTSHYLLAQFVLVGNDVHLICWPFLFKLASK